MPKNKFQGFIFSVLMSVAMTYGMEVYNNAINMGFQANPDGLSSMGSEVFLCALSQAWYMAIIVFVISSLWGNKMGTKFMMKHCDPEKDNPYFCQLMRQAGTIAFMCPAMSLVASVLFNVIMAGMPLTQLPTIWIGTFLKNFPMAFFWNMFAAAPFSHWVFGKLFSQKEDPSVLVQSVRKAES